MNEENLLRLWGKTDKNNPNNYHPLLLHMIDVGHVMERLWSEALSPRLQCHLAEVMGLSVEETKKLVVLLAAQHDLGKASAFQRKDAGLWSRLNEVGLDISNPIDRPHGYVSAQALRKPVLSGIGGWQANDTVVYTLAKITGGHHGTFPTSDDMPSMSKHTTGDQNWEELRRDLLRKLSDALFPEEKFNDNPIICQLEELTDSAILPLIGGLISVADWIGSSYHFPPAGPKPIADYIPDSRQQAEEALQKSGWSKAPIFAVTKAFGQMFQGKDGTPFIPNAMQQKTVEWVNSMTEPYLLIIEAAMGDGKTEAALYATDQALSNYLARGFYVGLPTQATGNAMFQRVKKYLENSSHGGPLNLQLAHAGALLSEEFEKLLHEASIYDDTADAKASADEVGQEGRVVAEGWFTARKRPLLARFGVGTIDQSLMGVLQTRHWFVRLLGLAGKVVIFDEVHAYDVYMSSLLCRLLGWLRALDCTVILLSATLPTSSCAALVAAWDHHDTPLTHMEYPRLTLCRADAPPEVCSVEEPNSTSKDVMLAWVNCDWGSVLERMRGDLPEGGCALLLCNTVTRAQDAFQILLPILEADGWKVRLFHARTPAAWRKTHEKWVLKNFDKNSPTDRRGLKLLLIATTIVEQSLDLDFDWIASEMAPADLILQRMGRLWRHPGRVRSLAHPHFIILCGQNGAGFPEFPDFAELIYERYVLLRSWLTLQNYGKTISLPAAIDPLVQAAYAETSPQDLSSLWLAELDKSLAEMKDAQEKDENKAKAVAISDPQEGPDGMLELGSTLEHVRRKLWDDDDPSVHETVRAATRLGDPSISIICTGTDENGESLAMMTVGEPNLQQTRGLLSFGLPLSRPKSLFKLLVDDDPPMSWKKSALLRYQRSIEFTNGVKTLGEYHLRLSHAEGLVIKKQGHGVEE